MQNKKMYIIPKIKAINLDEEQAILQVCQVGGPYFKFSVCVRSGGGGAWVCNIPVKGVTDTTGGTAGSVENIPS